MTMWFKNIRLYALAEGFRPDLIELAAALQKCRFRPCSKSERTQLGWVSPLGVDSQHDSADELLHVLGPYVMLCLRKEEKILPAAVVNDAVNEQIRDIEIRQDRKVYRKEKLQLKDDAIASLLPRAFSRQRTVFAYLDVNDGLLVVNASSAALAEELISALRDALGSFPVRLLDVQESPMAVLTRWLRDYQTSDHFVIDQDCELINPMEDGNIIRCKAQDLSADEVRMHLAAGKQVKKLGVVWNDAVRCMVNADLTLSRVRFEDRLIERAHESEAQDAAQQFDQDFAVMTLELSALFRSLWQAFGGRVES